MAEHIAADLGALGGPARIDGRIEQLALKRHKPASIRSTAGASQLPPPRTTAAARRDRSSPTGRGEHFSIGPSPAASEQKIELSSPAVAPVAALSDVAVPLRTAGRHSEADRAM
jgi:hypothetical protein